MPTGSPPVVPDYRLNLGDSSDFTGGDGRVWLRDIFTTGSAVDECATSIISAQPDLGLFCKYRQWSTPSTGRLLLPASIPGYYKVTLHFTETTAAPGERIFDVFALGYRVYSGIDVASLLGGFGVFALDITGYSIDGTIDIEIIATAGQPQLSAIERDYVPTAVVPFEIRVNSGASTSFVDSTGKTWIADNFFSGGSPFSLCPFAIDGTIDDELYCSERFGMFNYTVPIPGHGLYRVVLHFAELVCKWITYFFDVCCCCCTC
jgi:Malectin domain